MSICYMMIGVPGSGKSTICEDLIKKTSDLEIVSTDVYIDNYAKKKGKKYDEVYREVGDDAQKWMNKKIQSLIKEKKNFIWDQTNVFKSARRKKIATLKQNKYNIVAVSLELTYEELKKRLQNRLDKGGKKVPFKIIEEMIKAYERPSYEEGFLDIYLIKDDGIALLLDKLSPLKTSNSSLLSPN